MHIRGCTRGGPTIKRRARLYQERTRRIRPLKPRHLRTAALRILLFILPMCPCRTREELVRVGKVS